MAVTFDCSGQTVLVTGGSSGIGRAIAEAFRTAGADVWITGTAASIGDYPPGLADLHYRQLDLADGAAIERLAAELPRLDVLVNAAGVIVRDAAAYAPAQVAAVLEVNLLGSYRMTWAVRPQLAAARGAVVNIASMTSYFASPGAPGYGASKAALLQLTKTLAAAWAADGIRVNGIAPGWIATKLTEYWRAEGRDRALLARTPLGRWGRPEEIASAALFLASPAASFITGTTLPVDGGYSAV